MTAFNDICMFARVGIPCRDITKIQRLQKRQLRESGFSTGDLGTVDRAGYYYIVDRKKDMIVSGGENIYPREIEEVLFRHPEWPMQRWWAFHMHMGRDGSCSRGFKERKIGG
jgi:acyl-CoA synthetase (AMP-forming)/AMP-acid ligase II